MPRVIDFIAPGVNKVSTDYLYEAHSAYNLYINRWKFLADSFKGGYDYYRGKHLEPFYYESTGDYEKRLRQNALENHVSSIVGIYNSYLYRRPIYRDYGNLNNDPAVKSFLKDADLDGRTYDALIRDISTNAMVYGHVWVVVDKSNVQSGTRAEELAQDIRPYVSVFTPENILNWEYKREANGLYTLDYLKVREEVTGNKQYIREYTPEEIVVYEITEDKPSDANVVARYPNELGKIPATCVYAQRSDIRGVGISAINDIADLQRSIYAEYAEITDLEQLTNHPSLVLHSSTTASAGAGAMITVPEDVDGNYVKPYLLQPNGQSIDSLLNSIKHKIETIDKIACLGGIRSVESRRLSGIGLQTEFQTLGAKLSSFGANMELAEEQIWRLFALYQDTVWDGDIEYPRSFSIQDKANEITTLKMAKEAGITNTAMNAEIDRRIMETIIDNPDEYREFEQNIQEPLSGGKDEEEIEHPEVGSAEQLVSHLREMINEGYTNEQIQELHPELGRLFNRGE